MSLTGLTLDDYQKDAVAFMLKKKGCGVYFAQGTGKTIVTLAALDKLLQKNPNLKALIICQLSLVDATWYNAINKYANHLLDCVDVVHYENAIKYTQKYRRRNYDVIAIDESQRLNSRSSKTSSMARSLRIATYKWALSGTPIDGHKEELNPIGLWAQFRFFAPHVFGDVWEPFAEKYLRKTGFKGKEYRFKQHMLAEFKRKSEEYIIRVNRSVLGLIPMKIIPVRVNMTAREKTAYTEMLTHKIYSNPKVTSSAPLAVTAMIRLQQITSGYLKDDDTEEKIKLGDTSSKQFLLRKYFNEYAEDQIVVFCKFVEDLKYVQEMCVELGFSFRLLWGQTTDVDRIKDDFQAGKFQVLISQVKKGGVGLDLYAARIGIVYSLTFSSIDWEQLKARLHRRGQKREVRIYVLLAKDTIDEYIYDVLKNKVRFNKQLLDYFSRSKKLWLSRPRKKQPRQSQ